jgi:SSS family solute:Na+ symporter
MGFVILAMARTMSEVTGFNLSLLIFLIGIVTTLYTMVGGYRGVVWTDVVQFFLMLFGAIGVLIVIAFRTGSSPFDWISTAVDLHSSRQSTQWISFDPYERTSILTFALTMFVWHACIHLGNQMTVQRYFSTTDLTSARKSFVLAVVGNIAINAMLALVGMAILYMSLKHNSSIELSQEKKADMIFPRFIVEYLPAGMAGGVLTAVLAAAMSTISSGFNSLATVLTIERNALKTDDKMKFARTVTLASGLVSTFMAFGIDNLVQNRNIVEMMPRSFNCFTAPLGGLFLIGIFMPWIRARAILPSTLIAFASAIAIAYGKEIFGFERNLSFTLVMPFSLLVMVVSANLLNFIFPGPCQNIIGLTWQTKNQKANIPSNLLAQD